MTNAAHAPPRDPIYGLDVIRFAAALLVTVFHFGFRLTDGSPMARTFAGIDRALIGPWQSVWFGWVGVQVFFVISGLVIAYSLEGATRWSFLRARAARLIPAMLICASVSAIVMVAAYDLPVAQAALLWVRSIVFFPFGPWIAAQFWTLPIEVCFYAIIWAVAVGRPARLVPLAWGLALFSVAFWLAAAAGLGMGNGRLTQLIPLQHGCYFAIGIALAGWDARRIAPGSLVLVAICLATSLVQVRATALAEGLAFDVARFWPVAWGTFAVGVAAIVASMRWKRLVARFVSPALGRVLRALGLLTYPLYLVHFPLGCVVMMLALARGVPTGVAVALATLGSVAVAAVIARWLEPPLHRAVKRALGGAIRR